MDYLQAAYKNYVHGTLFQRALATGTPPLSEIGCTDAAGLTIIITGPTSGIGWATAAELARRGATVVLACRSESKGRDMVQRLTAAAAAAGQPPPSLEINLLDLASLDSVRQFVARWEATQRPVHVLINNAGLFNMGVGRGETKDGFEVHMQTNHLSHFLLTLGLLPALQRAAQQPPPAAVAAAAAAAGTTWRPRVVNVASAMHHFGYSFGPGDPQMQQQGSYSAARAYGNSKLAQMLAASELQRRLPQQQAPGSKAGCTAAAVDVVCLHPGNVLTDVVRSLPPLIQRLYRALMGAVLFTPEQGARASVYAATDPAAVAASAATGGYLDASARPVQPSRAARDAQLAAWCWAWSKEQVQLPAGWEP